MAAKISFTILEATELPKFGGVLVWKLQLTTRPDFKEKSLKVKKPPSGQNYMWNQTFEFVVLPNELKDGKLVLLLYEKVHVKKSDSTGRLEIPYVYFVDQEQGEEWFELEHKVKDKVTSGKVRLKYKYEFLDEVPPEPKPKEKKKKKLTKEISHSKMLKKTTSKGDIEQLSEREDNTERSTTKSQKKKDPSKRLTVLGIKSFKDKSERSILDDDAKSEMSSTRRKKSKWGREKKDHSVRDDESEISMTTSKVGGKKKYSLPPRSKTTASIVDEDRSDFSTSKSQVSKKKKKRKLPFHKKPRATQDGEDVTVDVSVEHQKGDSGDEFSSFGPDDADETEDFGDKSSAHSSTRKSAQDKMESESEVETNRSYPLSPNPLSPSSTTSNSDSVYTQSKFKLIQPARLTLPQIRSGGDPENPTKIHTMHKVTSLFKKDPGTPNSQNIEKVESTRPNSGKTIPTSPNSASSIKSEYSSPRSRLVERHVEPNILETQNEKPVAKPKQAIIPEPNLSSLFSADDAVDEELPHDILYKIIIIGDSGVGKTQFYNRWLHNTVEETKATISYGFGAKSYRVNGLIVKVQLWDTAGQERYRSLAKQYYRGSHGVILMYTIDDESTFVNMPQWIDDINQYVGEESRLLLVGNKNDQEENRQVSTHEALKLAHQKEIAFLETSAIDGNNCGKAVQLILQEIHTIQQAKVQFPLIPVGNGSVLTPRIGNTGTVIIGDGKEPPQKQKGLLDGCCK